MIVSLKNLLHILRLSLRIYINMEIYEQNYFKGFVKSS
jgi:hypothetical protein